MDRPPLLGPSLRSGNGFSGKVTAVLVDVLLVLSASLTSEVGLLLLVVGLGVVGVVGVAGVVRFELLLLACWA